MSQLDKPRFYEKTLERKAARVKSFYISNGIASNFLFASDDRSNSTTRDRWNNADFVPVVQWRFLSI